MEFEPNWKPPSNEPRLDISLAIASEALQLVHSQTPDLVDLSPVRNTARTRVRLADGWVGAIVDFSISPIAIPTMGDLTSDDLPSFGAAAARTLVGSHRDLLEVLGATYFSFTKFSYVGPYRDEKLSWPHVVSHLVDWLNGFVVPEVLSRNQARVLRALPSPPQIDIGRIANALWVLECEEWMCQGTAFALEGVGLVTCDHVLGPKTMAFRAASPRDKRPVSVRKREATLDLAIVDVEGIELTGLMGGSADNLKQLDQVTICGFPNYRIGDSGTIVPGFVVGFRPVAGIRRILTNAPIIGGTSGGPAMDTSGKVIGVAVTGADRMESAQSTENHGIIPIDALSFLRAS